MTMSTLGILRDYATLIAACIAAVGVIIALFAYLANKNNQREALVQRAYFDYAKMAVEKPELAFPANQKLNFQNQTFNGDALEFERYEWFVSSMLATVHFISRVERSSKHWHEMMINQVAYHWRYIEHFRMTKLYLQNWDKELTKILDEGLARGRARYNGPSPEA